MTYLDNASTTWVYPECIEGIEKVMKDFWGNPSNVYSFSDKPRQIIKEAKNVLAQCINCEPEEIYFTSGASEGNAWAMSQRPHTFVSGYEHHNYQHHPNAVTVDDGYIKSLRVICEQFNDHMMYSEYAYAHMLVNNITGEDFGDKLPELFNICKDLGMLTICDCTQAFGNIPVDVKELGCDMAIFSGHKFHAPKGIGFVYIKQGTEIKPLIYGTQQKGLRGGTENVPYIEGLKIAADKAIDTMGYKLKKSVKVKKKVEELLMLSDIDYWWFTNGIPETIFFCLAGVESEVIQSALNEDEIYIGVGSGCTDGSMQIDPALEASGIPDKYIRGPIRLSIDVTTPMVEIEYTVKKIIDIYKQLVR